MPERYARHYYDLYCLGHSSNKKKALDNLELLYKVVDFKRKFYPRGWAKYEDAKAGTLKLVPPLYRFEELQKDYQNMTEMFFDEYPDFQLLMEYIKELETEINSLG